MTSSDLCRFLSWDSDFFGVRIGRITSSRLEPDAVETIRQWAQAEQIDCLYFLADSDHQQSTQLAEAAGMALQDIRLTFGQKLVTPPPAPDTTGLHFRTSQPDDLKALRAVARDAYVQSRFFVDPCFPADRCADLYGLWLEKSLSGDLASVVTIAELEGQPVAYITCKVDEAGTGTIGLVGVAEAARGQQLGQKLMHYTLGWFYDQGAQQVEVATQGRNISAQRLYQRSGFLTQSVQLWYHWWLTDCRSL